MNSKQLEGLWDKISKTKDPPEDKCLTGIPGVIWERKKYRVYFNHRKNANPCGRATESLGGYKTLDEAVIVRRVAEIRNVYRNYSVAQEHIKRYKLEDKLNDALAIQDAR